MRTSAREMTDRNDVERVAAATYDSVSEVVGLAFHDQVAGELVPVDGAV